MTTDGQAIRWPARFHPDRAPVHVRNELYMAAAPTRVFARLIAAPSWPDWYPNASKVTLLDGATTLSLGTRFRWTTFGARIVSEVAEFVPNERIAWTGRAPGIDIYHAWLIRPSEHGSFVLTEETQYGLLARLAAAAAPGRMSRHHQIWLERLEAQAA